MRMERRRKIAGGIIRFRYWILTVILLAAVLSVLMIPRTRINYDLNQYLSEDTMTKKALVVMEEEFGGVELGDPEASRDMQNRIGAEIPLVMGISLAIVVAVLLLTSHAWLEPVPILATLGVSILINMGTNFIFPNVSFITFAVSAILQLALSIDYAIMLLHTFNACRDGGLSGPEAMKEALAECFMRVSASALTTVAGLLSLLFMSFRIGFDIGMVLSKGILISMACVFLMMPAVILMMHGPLQKTRHRPLRLGGAQWAHLIWKIRKPAACLLLIAVAGGIWASSGTVYSFSESATVSRGETLDAEPAGRVQAETEGTAEPSGDPTERARAVMASNPLVLLVPGGDEDADYDRQRQLAGLLGSLQKADGAPAVEEIIAMVTTGAQALAYYTPAEAAKLTGMPELLVSLFFASQGFGDAVRADRLLTAAGQLTGDNETVTALGRQLAEAERIFNGPRYARMILKLNFGTKDADFGRNMDGILEAVRSVYGSDFYATGHPMSTYDIATAFRSDLLVVNLITLAAIFLIVALSFRSLRLSFVLVLVIEGAIWITMGISRLMGQSVFFISYLICLSIQMGATIDYAILLTDQYRTARGTGRAPREALSDAMRQALPTVLTSGTILITAGYIIGKICTIYYIASIGALLARGALVSVLLVLSLLPALLTLGDRFLIRGKQGNAA